MTNQPIEEKCNWREEFDEKFGVFSTNVNKRPLTSKAIESFIENLLEQERRRLTIKNAGLYRQLFGEMSSDKTFTAKEVWEIMNSYQPLFTREQEEEIKSIINK